MINIFVFSDNFSHLSITKSCKEKKKKKAGKSMDAEMAETNEA
jgi:hypothetical protein